MSQTRHPVAKLTDMGSFAERYAIVLMITNYCAFGNLLLMHYDVGQKFLRCGQAFQGVTLLAAWFLLFVLAGMLLPDPLARPLWLYFLSICVMLSFHVLEVTTRKLRGIKLSHPAYSGTPYLLALMPRSLGEWLDRHYMHPEEFVKLWVEPIAVVLAGKYVFYVNPYLGAWLIWSGLCQWVVMRYSKAKTDETREEIATGRADADYYNEPDKTTNSQNPVIAVCASIPEERKPFFSRLKPQILEEPEAIEPNADEALKEKALRLDPSLQALMEEAEELETIEPVAKPKRRAGRPRKTQS